MRSDGAAATGLGRHQERCLGRERSSSYCDILQPGLRLGNNSSSRRSMEEVVIMYMIWHAWTSRPMSGFAVEVLLKEQHVKVLRSKHPYRYPLSQRFMLMESTLHRRHPSCEKGISKWPSADAIC